MKKFISLSLFAALCQCILAQNPVEVATDSVSTDSIPIDTLSSSVYVPTDTLPVRAEIISTISEALIDSVVAGHVVVDTIIPVGLPQDVLTLKCEDKLATVEQATDELAAHRLFSDEMRASCPTVVLDYVEAAYRQHFDRPDDDNGRFSDISFAAGSWDMLRLVNDTTACALSLVNGHTYRIIWQDLAEMVFPVQYDCLLGGSRSEIENRLIARLVETSTQPVSIISDSISATAVAEDSCYTVKGEIYGISPINRDYYLQNRDGQVTLVFDSIHPAQSLANLFVCGIDSLQVPMTIAIPKHEYGVRDTIQTTVATLNEVCGADGCLSYWGTELLTEDYLRGSVFLYNLALGYDHVLRVECDPRLIGTDKLSLKCRMSLFIPTTNIKDLYVTIGPKEASEVEQNE